MNNFNLPEGFDLNRSMNTLYDTGEYFVRLPYRASGSFEEEYHETVFDPDGRIRDLTSEDEKRHKLANFQGEILDELKGFSKIPRKIMDVGCGPGWLLSALDGHWEKYGVEVSSFAAKIAQSYGDVEAVSIENYRHPKNEFDVVVIHHVIEHLTDPSLAISKIYEMLKPGGLLIIGTPDFDCGAARRYGNDFRLLHDKTHVSLFSNDSMHRFLRDMGFKVQKVEYPFFDTTFFNEVNLMRLLENKSISPPFYGSVMTFFAVKP